jgi:hypothetical protein
VLLGSKYLGMIQTNGNEISGEEYGLEWLIVYFSNLLSHPFSKVLKIRICRAVLFICFV